MNILIVDSEDFLILQQNLHATFSIPEFLHKHWAWDSKLQFIQPPMALVSSSLAQTGAKETSQEVMGGMVKKWLCHQPCYQVLGGGQRLIGKAMDTYLMITFHQGRICHLT